MDDEQRPALADTASCGRRGDRPAPEEVLTDAQRMVYVATPSAALILLLLMIVLGMYKPARSPRGHMRSDR